MGASRLEDAQALQEQGKLKEARDLFRTAAAESRAAGNQQDAITALSAAGSISVSLGDSAGAIADAEQAIQLRQALKINSGLGYDFNTLGLAHANLGDFPAALENYQDALKAVRAEGDGAGEIRELNNIGNIYYYQGRYVPALDFYQQALVKVNATTAEIWNPWGRRMTNGNIALIYQRVGLEERALELYQQASGKPETMAPSEYAQLLQNEGVLYRHMGDPLKALELYRTAQSLLRSDHNADSEVGALRLIGIVKEADLGDLNGALDAFTEALKLSRQSSNIRGVVQASLYLGETLRRLGRMAEARRYLNTALDEAQKAGLVEEQWKSLYALGKIAEAAGNMDEAADDYRKAIAIIEAIRAGLRVVALRSDFLADKRDVYDSLIALRIQQPAPAVGEIFQWMEHSRARTLVDRVATRTPLREASLQQIQSLVPHDAVLIEFWTGNESSLAVWITSTETGIVRYGSPDDIRADARALLAAVQEPGDKWKVPSRSLGNRLLTGISLRPHVIIVPDGPLNIPFETLSIPGSELLLVEKSDVTYLPAARFLEVRKTTNQGWSLPWRRQLVAFGDPPVSSSDALAEKEQWQPLPASADEVRGIAKILPGQAEIHLGNDARKGYLLDHSLENLPFLHLSTHALIDAENPNHSRVLLAADSSRGADYIFQEEVYNLDLKNVGLVTLSACDTARGKMVQGEGIQAFSQAFLAAGASATLTSQWRVADQPTASFMEQYYYFLSHGGSRSEALQAVKLKFFHSNSELSSPRYWAAFVLNGDGLDSPQRVVPWSVLLLAAGALLAIVSFTLWRLTAIRAGKREQHKAAP